MKMIQIIIISWLSIFGSNQESQCVSSDLISKHFDFAILDNNQDSLQTFTRVLIPNELVCYSCYKKEDRILILRTEKSDYSRKILRRTDKANLPNSTTLFTKKKRVLKSFRKNVLLEICLDD